MGVEERKRVGRRHPAADVAAAGGRSGCGGGGGGGVEQRQVLVEVVAVGEAGRRGCGGGGGGGRGDEAEGVLEEGLVAGERERAGTAGGEAVLLLRLPEEPPEDGVVEMRRADHEPPRGAPNTHRHVSGRHVRRRSRRRRRAQPPPPQHLPETHDVPDLATFAHSPSHFPEINSPLINRNHPPLLSLIYDPRARGGGKGEEAAKAFIGMTFQQCP